MVDIETLGTDGDDVPILSVALVRFDPYYESDYYSIKIDEDNWRYEVLPICPQVDAFGRKPNGHTLLWWGRLLQEGHPVVREVFDRTHQLDDLSLIEQEEHLLRRLETLKNFLDPDDYLWAKPANFDIPKLASLMKQCAFELPVPWYRWRCMTGAKSGLRLAGVKEPKVQIDGRADHHALFDAIEQTLELQAWLRGATH
jgi:hypothetical protein